MLLLAVVTWHYPHHRLHPFLLMTEHFFLSKFITVSESPGLRLESRLSTDVGIQKKTSSIQANGVQWCGPDRASDIWAANKSDEMTAESKLSKTIFTACGGRRRSCSATSQAVLGRGRQRTSGGVSGSISDARTAQRGPRTASAMTKATLERGCGRTRIVRYSCCG